MAVCWCGQDYTAPLLPRDISSTVEKSGSAFGLCPTLTFTFSQDDTVNFDCGATVAEYPRKVVVNVERTYLVIRSRREYVKSILYARLFSTDKSPRT